MWYYSACLEQDWPWLHPWNCIWYPSSRTHLEAPAVCTAGCGQILLTRLTNQQITSACQSNRWGSRTQCPERARPSSTYSPAARHLIWPQQKNNNDEDDGAAKTVQQGGCLPLRYPTWIRFPALHAVPWIRHKCSLSTVAGISPKHYWVWPKMKQQQQKDFKFLRGVAPSCAHQVQGPHLPFSANQTVYSALEPGDAIVFSGAGGGLNLVVLRA